MTRTRLWHGFADMHKVASDEVVLTKGDGVWIEDAAGRRYLDATGGLWFAAVGFGRREIARAAVDQMARLHAYSNFGAYATAPTTELATRLSELAPIDQAVVFFTSGGSEAVDTAAKLARRFWHVMGRPQKRVIVARERSYHGMAAYGTSLAGIPGNREGYGGPLIEEVELVPADDIQCLELMFSERADRIAAFIGEPVIGAGGVFPPIDGYWAAVQELCRRHDVLLIADEVVTGFGRTGWMFASQKYGFAPDMVIFAKAVTSGYVPLGGVLIGPRVSEPFWSERGNVFRHGYTYSGHATACSAALANLDIIERERLVERVRTLEPYLAEAAHRLRTSPLVSDVRVVGLTAAIEVDGTPDLVERVVTMARHNGVLTRSLQGRALHVSPAFIITEKQIDHLISAFHESLVSVSV